MIGELVGGYRLGKKLGEGATGEAYLAQHPASGQSAVAKILFPQMCTDAVLIGRFFDDVKTASLVNHSGICDLYDCGVLPSGRAFVVLEHLEGKTLTDSLVELGQVSDVESLADIAWQLATILRAAHDARIVHGALKPDAVFLTFPPGQAPRPLVKLVDFGMAKFRLGVRHSQTGSLLGAPLYMSPEVGRGLGNTDHRADIYSLGCIMFEMACGRPPFVREGEGELLIAHATLPAPFVSSLEPSIPPAIDQLIGRMLTKNPQTRPQDMAEVAQVLEKFFNCPTPVAEFPSTAPPPIFPQLPNAPMVAKTAVVAEGARASAAATARASARRSAEPTAMLPPAGEVPATSDTAMLPPEPRSTWLAQVRKKATLIEPLVNAPMSAPVAREEPSRKPTRQRPPEPRSVPRPAAARVGVSRSINLPVVVISAAIVLVVAAVVLLLRRDPGHADAKNREPQVSGGRPPSANRGVTPAFIAPEAPRTASSRREKLAASPQPTEPPASRVETETQTETDPEAEEATVGEHRLQPSSEPDDPALRGKSRRRW